MSLLGGYRVKARREATEMPRKARTAECEMQIKVRHESTNDAQGRKAKGRTSARARDEALWSGTPRGSVRAGMTRSEGVLGRDTDGSVTPGEKIENRRRGKRKEKTATK